MGVLLVAYDGSDAASKAMEHAINLLKPVDELIIVSVVPSASIKEFADVDPEISLIKTQERLNLALSELRERGIEARGVIREGDIADEILKLGAELHCDLIVVGYKGLSKIGRFQLGSVADKVARYANRPVMIVR